MNFLEWGGHGPRTNRLDFVGNLDPMQEFFKRYTPQVVLSQFYSLGDSTGLGGGLYCPSASSYLLRGYHMVVFISARI